MSKVLSRFLFLVLCDVDIWVLGYLQNYLIQHGGQRQKLPTRGANPDTNDV